MGESVPALGTLQPLAPSPAGLAPIEFYFDFSCPYAYLGSLQLHAVATRSGRAVALRPFLLGGVFQALGQAQHLSATLSPAKQRYNRLDLLRQARWLGAPLVTPLRHPNRTVDALRTLLATPTPDQPDVMAAFFAAYWRDAADLADAAVRRDRLVALGLDADAIEGAASSPAIRQALHACTQDALDRGVFGAPAFVVDGSLWWGSDRVEQVVRAARDDFAVAEDVAFAFS